jgi:hypothetical protein
MKKFVNLVILFIVISILFTGCISDKGGNNEEVELSITNETDEPTQVLITISYNDRVVYNQTIVINSTEKIIINEFDRGFGKYYIYIFIDNERMIEGYFVFDRGAYPVQFIIKEDKIDWGQTRV